MFLKYVRLDKDDAKSKAHYSPAVIHEKIIYVSGQLPLKKGEKVPSSDNIEDQTKIVLEKLKQILEAANSSIDKVLRTTIYISEISYWDRVNAVYAEFFGDHKPARTIVPTKTLHYYCLIELDAIAFQE
ncbi:MAG: RidA family protein [Asgard group archaeon]|nr:RidA family protein [Asgard group archaeon]